MYGVISKDMSYSYLVDRLVYRFLLCPVSIAHAVVQVYVSKCLEAGDETMHCTLEANNELQGPLAVSQSLR